jgi:hypothetical protein
MLINRYREEAGIRSHRKSWGDEEVRLEDPHLSTLQRPFVPCMLPFELQS